MNILKSSLIVLFLVLTGSSCFFFKKGTTDDNNDSAKKGAASNPVTYKSMTEIVFGRGGGFTGMVEEYHLWKDGTLKQGDEVKKKIDKKQMKVILKAFKKIDFSKVNVNDPGNLYYFMAAKNKDNEQRLVWNDQTVLPPEVKMAYDELINVTK